MIKIVGLAILSLGFGSLFASIGFADDIYRPSPREAYQPATYCQRNRTGLPQRFREICDREFPEHVAKWEEYETDTGASLKIDVNSIHHFGPTSSLDGFAAITIYEVGDGRFNPYHYHTILFDCRGNYKEWTSTGDMNFAPPRSVMGQVSEYACSHTSVKSENTIETTIASVATHPAAQQSAETYSYTCESQGRSSTLMVNATNKTLEWLGHSYKITEKSCGKAGWHAERDGMSFDFCTATQGYADFDLPTGTVQCKLRHR